MLSHNVMRTALLGFVGLVALTTSVGCGPGLTRHSHAKAPEQSEVFTTMDAELKNALVGTTTLTSAEPMPLPDSRLPLAQWDGDEAASRSPAPLQTWGASQAQAPGLDPSPYEAAPAAPAIPAEIPAKRDPLSFP